jgi:hypothetical protein
VRDKFAPKFGEGRDAGVAQGTFAKGPVCNIQTG